MRIKFNFQEHFSEVKGPIPKKTDLTPTPEELEKLEANPNKYPLLRSLIGGLNYVYSTTRPDIAFACSYLSRFQNFQTFRVWEFAKDVLRYLLNTPKKGIEYSPQREKQFNATFKKVAQEGNREKLFGKLTVFTDADYAGCVTTARSTSGCIMYVRGTPVCWFSRRQQLLATSTHESELYALNDAVKLTKSFQWFNWICQKGDTRDPVIYCDNMATIQSCRSEFIGRKSRHINVRYFNVRQHLNQLCHVVTTLNLSDALTKPMKSSQTLYPSECFLSICW
jgi:hypothetical protein